MTDKKCSNCKHVYVEYDAENHEFLYRCEAPVPFWVSTLDRDYGSWINEDHGKNCKMFTLKDELK
jgi:hypothetical protein